MIFKEDIYFLINCFKRTITMRTVSRQNSSTVRKGFVLLGKRLEGLGLFDQITIKGPRENKDEAAP